MRSELGVAAFARMVMTVLALVLPVVAEGKDFPVAAEAPLASNEEGLPQLRAQMAALQARVAAAEAAELRRLTESHATVDPPRTVENCILGAGAGGLQLGYFFSHAQPPRDFHIFERHSDDG